MHGTAATETSRSAVDDTLTEARQTTGTQGSRMKPTAIENNLVHMLCHRFGAHLHNTLCTNNEPSPWPRWTILIVVLEEDSRPSQSSTYTRPHFEKDLREGYPPRGVFDFWGTVPGAGT